MRIRLLATSVVLFVIAIIVAALTYPPSLVMSASMPGELRPGSVVALDLTLANPHGYAVTVSSVSVAIDSVRDSRTGQPSRCSTSNFEVLQTPAVRLVIPRHQSLSYSMLGLVPSRWPRIRMLDSPVPQDACMHSTLVLRFQAAAFPGRQP